MGEKQDAPDWYSSKYYFKMGDAWNDLSHSEGARTKVITGSKLFGKAICNVALFSSKLLVEMAKELPNRTAEEIEKKRSECAR